MILSNVYIFVSWIELIQICTQNLNIFSLREARISVRRLITGTEWKRRAQHTKLSITHSFFELETPDFAWKFVWTIWTIFDKILKKKNGRQITKLSITHSFLELQTPDLAWKFVWTVWTNFDKILKNKWPPKNKLAAKS